LKGKSALKIETTPVTGSVLFPQVLVDHDRLYWFERRRKRTRHGSRIRWRSRVGFALRSRLIPERASSWIQARFPAFAVRLNAGGAA